MVTLGHVTLDLPIIQAPMAGVSTPALAAAVSNAGGLGSLGIAAMTLDAARAAITDTRALTARPFNVNVFCHRPAQRNAAREAGWLALLGPLFAEFGSVPPDQLTEIYPTFVGDDQALAMLVETRPDVVSFHFGLPTSPQIAALREAAIMLMATATSVDEAAAIDAAGIDVIVAQGWQAGGHRGIFEPDGPDDRLATEDLVRGILAAIDRPVVAAGGIMDGADIARMLALGATSVQMGTAFVTTPESAADAAYRARFQNADDTLMSAAISGRPARGFPNRLTALIGQHADYPLTYDATKQLAAAAKAAGRPEFGAQWSGTGAADARPMPASELVRTLARELDTARG